MAPIVTPLQLGGPRTVADVLGGGVSFPTTYFSLPFTDSAVDNLSPSLTINGITETPVFRYEGKNASASGWTATVGNALGITAGTNAPTYNQALPLLDATDLGVKFNGTAANTSGKGFVDGGATLGDLSTEDAVWEELFLQTGLNNGVLLSKYREDDTNSGWMFLSQSSGIRFLARATSNRLDRTETLSNGWHHLMLFYDASAQSAIMYINGTAGTAFTSSGGPYNFTSSAPLAMSHFYSAATPVRNAGNNGIALAQMWKRSAWLNTHLQATIAAQRFASLTGLTSTAGTNIYPATRTRASAAHTTYSSKSPLLYRVGNGWMRQKETSAGSGVLIEKAVQNFVANSEALDGAVSPNTPTRCSFVASAATSPRGDATAYALHEDTTAANTHFFQTNNAGPYTQNSLCTVSLYAKKINRRYLQIYGGNGLSTIPAVIFDLQTGTVHNAGTATIYGIQNVGDGWYRCWVSRAISTNQYGYLVARMIADDGSSTSFDGADRDSYYIWGCMAHEGSIREYVLTAGSSATKADDILTYTTAAGADLPAIATGKMQVGGNVIAPSTNVGVNTILSVNDNTASNYVTLELDASGYAKARTKSGGGAEQTLTGAVNLRDNAEHAIVVQLYAGKGVLRVDGDIIAGPSAITYPAALTQLQVGTSEGDATDANLIISDIVVRG